MPSTERLTNQDQAAANVSRRQLLKALLAAGGALTAASLLPGEWSRPVVEIGVLPAHAQITPAPICGLTCRSGAATIQLPDPLFNNTCGPADSLRTYAWVDCVDSLGNVSRPNGVMLRRTIWRGDPATGSVIAGPTDGQTYSGTRDGECGPTSHPDVPLAGLGLAVGEFLTVRWESVDPGYGMAPCEHRVQIV